MRYGNMHDSVRPCTIIQILSTWACDNYTAYPKGYFYTSQGYYSILSYLFSLSFNVNYRYIWICVHIAY